MTMTRESSTSSTHTSAAASQNDTMVNLNDTESVWATLERLNHERAIYFLPAVIWVVILMIVGVIGNVLVIYVYRRRFKRTSSNYFILTMAIFDLVACLIGMPTEIYDLLKPFTFYSEFGCKVFRTTENFTVYGSVVVLVEIAFDRYFKICRPLMVVSLFKIKLLCVVAVGTAFLMATPSFVLYGITRNETPVPGIRGYDCSIADLYRHSAFQSAYFICLAVVFVVTLVILTVLYVRIWLELRQRRRMVIGDQLSKPKAEVEDVSEAKKFRVRYVPSMSEDEMIATNSRTNSATQLNSVSTATSLNNSSTTTTTTTSTTAPLTAAAKRSRFTSLAQLSTRLHVSRTTVVLFAVTVAFVLSFFPALTVMVVRTVVKDFDETQSMASLAATKIFSKFNFINNAINPIIYSFLNVNFRRQACKAVEKLLCCFRRRRHTHVPQKADSDRSTKKEFLHV
ncbi:hypothetical protein V1264_019997 [Littorina saxatilis]|uniref:G-protein coupled receptors family 1 profile domain-containing protein n=2 Tax=Littorina saxatilis TaxID=31220 RepID=A0AAN9BBP9_9CAEN